MSPFLIALNWLEASNWRLQMLHIRPPLFDTLIPTNGFHYEWVMNHPLLDFTLKPSTWRHNVSYTRSRYTYTCTHNTIGYTINMAYYDALALDEWKILFSNFSSNFLMNFCWTFICFFRIFINIFSVKFLDFTNFLFISFAEIKKLEDKMSSESVKYIKLNFFTKKCHFRCSFGFKRN